MAFSRFQMADVGDRRLDVPSDFFLSEVKLLAAFPDDSTKVLSLSLCHVPLLLMDRQRRGRLLDF